MMGGASTSGTKPSRRARSTATPPIINESTYQDPATDPELAKARQAQRAAARRGSSSSNTEKMAPESGMGSSYSTPGQ